MSIFYIKLVLLSNFFFKMRVPSVLLPGKADEILIIFFFFEVNLGHQLRGELPKLEEKGPWMKWSQGWNISWTWLEYQQGLSWTFISRQAEAKVVLPTRPLQLLVHLWSSVGSREHKGRLKWRKQPRTGNFFKLSSWCCLTCVLWEGRSTT